MNIYSGLHLKLLAVFCLSAIYSSSFGQAYDRAVVADCFQKQDFDRAIDYLHSNENSGKANVSFQTDLGYALYMNEQYADAKKYFQNALLIQPENAEALLYLAQVYSIVDNRDSALFFYENLLKQKPGNYRFWQRAGNISYQLGKFDTAWQYYSNAYRLNNRSGRIALALSNLLINDKKLNQADSIVSEFLLRDTTDEEIIAKKIDIAFKKSSYDTVIIWGEKLWRDSSRLSAPFVSLAYSYLNNKLYDKCLQLCNWLELKNNSSEAILYCEALAFNKINRFNESNAKLDECIKLSIREDAHTYLNAKADNYEDMKLYGNAANYYDTAWFLFQKPYDLYFAGRIYDKFYGNTSKAKYYYRLFQKNKAPARSDSEQRIIEYVRSYLEEKATKKAKK